MNFGGGGGGAMVAKKISNLGFLRTLLKLIPFSGRDSVVAV